MADNEYAAGADSSSSSSKDDDVHRVNAELRYAWLAATLDAKIANEIGDHEAAADAERRANNIREDFFSRNRRLAMSAGQQFLRHARGEDLRDHEQAALLGLWEAFAGTNPQKGRDISFGEDGKLVAKAGWDPAKATFGTLSRQYVTGRVQRSVASTETGLSYNLWSLRPKVLAAKEELIAEGNPAPSARQVAARCSVRLDTVQAILTPNATSLQTPIGTDGATLGDMLADTADRASGSPAFVENTDMLCAAAKDVKTTDLLSFALRSGIVGRPALTVVDTAARLGLGRGAVVSAENRTQAALTKVASSAVMGLAGAGLARTNPSVFAFMVANLDTLTATPGAKEPGKRGRKKLATV